MLVLFWTSTIPTVKGRFVCFPILVPDPDLDAFSARVVRDGGAMVTRLFTERRDDGFTYILEERPVFIGLAGTATIRNADTPVRREVD